MSTFQNTSMTTGELLRFAYAVKGDEKDALKGLEDRSQTNASLRKEYEYCFTMGALNASLTMRLEEATDIVTDNSVSDHAKIAKLRKLLA
jgi:hypothetical protein